MFIIVSVKDQVSHAQLLSASNSSAAGAELNSHFVACRPATDIYISDIHLKDAGCLFASVSNVIVVVMARREKL